ncbi:hypothetical protein PPYR_00575 [Photinus pyralis]|uniref:Uncharacterized protein n=1 Tax=Photinus pyralis TaxID=7054 RepID=A0A5N4B1Z2_PHOPY|nr:laminin subunit alpha-1-like [Photinus pyralis]KAB0803605.1 hypothetical protein PPYR_00575 [Photinus pyralis]
MAIQVFAMFGCALLTLGVVLLLTVGSCGESLAKTVRQVDENPYGVLSPFGNRSIARRNYKLETGGNVDNNKDSNNNEVSDYENGKKRKRRRRSIKKKLADRVLLQKEEAHKVRHHHGEKFVRERILSDEIERRKRNSYVTQDGVVHYKYNPIVPCYGWNYYSTYRCTKCICTRETCFPRRCESLRPTTTGVIPEVNRSTTRKPTPHIYTGPGKYWLGPRLGCNCNLRGSELSTCDITTGQCRCKQHYVGRTCDRCQDGYWEHIAGCTKCECDIDGSYGSACNERTGQCNCKPGIGGTQCNNCLPNYFGFSSSGCKECEPCNKRGHICDPDTGRCICPAYSYGEYCQLCTINAWGYEPNKGCKACNCSNSGSLRMQCDLATGECSCRLGFAGFNCDRCDHGYFGYPRCRRCNCNYSGSDLVKARCDKEGVCQCNEDGSCLCKPNVGGKRCDQCKEGTFGLQLDNPDGCTQCFCFGRSSKCSESGLTWGQIRMHTPRWLTTTVKKSDLARDIETSDKLLVAPDENGNVTINRYQFESPLYWRLHSKFDGDRILSYGGYLRFVADTLNPRQRLPQDVLNHYPLVQLRGHGKIVLEYYPPLPIKGNRYEVRLHESLWKRIYPKETHLTPRELLMVALQNIQNIFVKATDSASFEKLLLQDVILDTAIEVPGNPPPLAKGVEICECPRQYNSSSCQDPSIGFFRHYTPSSVNGTILIDTFVGQARACTCNDRSDICDTETGYCLGCRDNTHGRYCEKCADGYYGNPMLPFEKCQPCPCPSPTQNFASECRQLSKTNEFICNCKQGYTGHKCDSCSPGYYGQPQLAGGSCQPCNCNVEGTLSHECDMVTGACFCKPGISGRHCSQCEKPRHVLQQFKCTPCDKCTQWLLDDIGQLSYDLDQNTHFLLNGSIEPPWGTLRNIEKRYVFLNDKLATYLNNKHSAEELIANTSIDALKVRLNSLENRYNKLGLDDVTQKAAEIDKMAKDLDSELRESKPQLQQLIETLQNFGKSQISTQEAVKEGEALLREIQDIAKTMNYPHGEILSKCEQVKAVIEKLMQTTPNPQRVADELSTLKERLKDIDVIITNIELVRKDAELKNTGNKIRIDGVKRAIDEIQKKTKEIKEDVDNSKNMIKKAMDALEGIRLIYSELGSDDSLKDLVQQLQVRHAKLSRINPNGILEAVLQHVEGLEKKASEYAKLFNLSSKEINAVKASEAYANIKKYLDEASRLANEALANINTAMDTLSPEGKDSISTNASISMADSERLEIRIRHQIDNLADIKQRKDIVALKVKAVDSNNWRNGLTNRDQDNKLHEMKTQLNKRSKEKIQDLLNEAIDQTDRMKDVHRQAMNIDVSKDYELFKPYQKLLNLTSSDNLRKLQEQITVTQDELRNMLGEKHTYLDIIKQNTIKFNEFRTANNSLALKLQALKAQIKSAKKTAEGIRISLTGATCERSYKIDTLSPTLVSKLIVKFNYTLSSEPSTSSLFYLNTTIGQYMNLKIKDNHIVFSIKLGNAVIEHDYVMPQSDFYTVAIERIANYVEMTVNNEVVESKDVISPKSEVTLFKTSPQSLIHIGYALDAEPGITACIRDVIYNNYKIGMWNFHTSDGQCAGCIRSNELTLESTYDFYQGDGYSMISKEQQDKYANPAQFNVQFSLRTFDENALLFLAADPERKNYLAIFLNDGRIHYRVHYPNEEDIIMKTEKKYNNGEKVRISAEKVWVRTAKQVDAVLRVNDGLEVFNDSRSNIDSGTNIRLKKIHYYFGGVPPDYFLNSMGVTDTLPTHQSLLGGLEEVREYQLFSDDNIRKYSVTKQSGELEFRNVLFEGLGYIQLKAKRMEGSLFLMLRTKNPHGFVLFIDEVLSISMSEGKLVVKVYDRDETYTLTSKQSVNDEVYHLVEVVRLNTNVELKVNGETDDSIQTKETGTNKLSAETTLYLGGVPDTFSKLLEGNSLLVGEISDILIDNKLVKINKNTVQYFEKVKIGRSITVQQPMQAPKNFQEPDETKTEMKEMQNTEGCGVALNYTFDPNAAKFGDKPFSYVLHYLKDNFWRKDYKLGISFRTYQPNGVLFTAFGPRQHYNLLEIRGGRIVFKSNGKRLRNVELPQKVDDGNWYSVTVEASGVKKKRKLTVSINGYKTKPLRLPRNKISREIYIGGISENITLPASMKSNYHPFRGCIRGLTINKIPHGLIKDKSTVHHNIGQCFPNIEQGSYFGGDAFAIYNKYFHINAVLELSLEFRTAEQNGIIISVSNPRNSPALSIELQSGAIVMTTDNGYGTITNVTNNLSDFALCNNQWHNITAVYTSSEITINVDGIRKSWVQPDDETLMDELEAPLYIGGIPDYAPVGTLKMKENFKGCIRNMKIGKKTVDWLNMEQVTNVLLDSCPMTS